MTHEYMTEREFEEHLTAALFEYAESDGDAEPDIQTFAEAGILTTNKGLVVNLDGSQFQVTIVRTR